MALSFKSKTYNNISSELAGIKAQKGSITAADISAVAKANEVSVEDVKGAAQDYREAFKQANELFDKTGFTTGREDFINYFTKEPRIGINEYTQRTARVVGRQTARAGKFLGQAFLPDETIDNLDEAYKHFVPESARKEIQLFLDPETNTAEEISGVIGSYALPVSTILNTGRLVAQTPMMAAKLSRLSKKAKTAATAGGYGVGYASAATLIEDPRISIYDEISSAIFGNEEATKRLEALAKNPEDVEAQDYLEAFIRNLSIEGAFGAGIHSAGTIASSIAKSYRTGVLSPVKNKVTQIGDTTKKAARPYINKLDKITKPARRKTAQLFSSRMGTDDLFLASLIKRETAEEAAVIRADALAIELDKAITERVKNLPASSRDKAEEIILRASNDYLQYSEAGQQYMQSKFPDLYPILKEMRDKIDEASDALPYGAGKLKGIIDKNKGFYINRSYKVFDSPSYKKELSKKLLNRKENLSKVKEINTRVARGELSSAEGKTLKENLTDDVIERAAQYVANQRNVGITNNEVQKTLEEISRIEDVDTFTNFMQSLANKGRYTSSNDPLLQRQDIDVSIRELMGEVKDPRKNFVNTYVKLAKLNADYKFMEEIAGDLSVKFQNRVRKIREANPNLTEDQAIKEAQAGLVNLSSGVGVEKLEWITKGANKFVKLSGDKGRETLERYKQQGKISLQKYNQDSRALNEGKSIKLPQIINPLQEVYADKAYADAIKKGIDVTLPEIFQNKFFRGLVGAQAATQYAKTVANIPTHGKNMMGNIIMLTANGILPTGTSLKQAVKTTSSQLLNKNNKELAETLAEYVELGVTNSGIGLGIVRRNLKVASEDSGKYIDDITALRKAKNVGKKAADIYQAEDDFFKIIHFENTKNYLRKVYPNMDNNTLKQMAAQRTRDMMPNYRLVPKFIKGLGYSPFGDFVSFPAEMVRTTKNLVKYTYDDAKTAAFNSSDSNFNREALLQALAGRVVGMGVAGSFGDVAQSMTMSAFGITDEQDKAMTYLNAPYYMNTNRIYLGPIQKDKKTGHVIAPTLYLGSYDPYSIIKVGAKAIHQGLLEGEPLSEYEQNKLLFGTLEQTVYPMVQPSMFTQGIIDIVKGKQDFSSPEMGISEALGKQLIDLFDPSYLKYMERRKNYYNKGLSDSLYTISEGDIDVPALLGIRRTNQDLSAGISRNIYTPISKIKKADNRLKQILNNPNATPEEVEEEYINAQKIRFEGFEELRSVIQLYKDVGYTVEGLTQDITMGGKKRQLQPSELEMLFSADQNVFVPTEPKPRETFQGPLTTIPDSVYNLYQRLYNTRIEK
tara:strand:- start:366 stop:4289 length:3924 start_codon:yes stop_codon:yes gene_type:complete